MRRLRWSLVLLGFTACTTYWSKPGVSPEDFARDNYACEVDAGRVAPVSDVQAINVSAKERLHRSCMEAKGYRRH